MGRTNVAEGKARRCVATELPALVLAMKPVVLAREHRVSDENFRDLRKHNDCAEHDERRSGVDQASVSKF